MLTMNQAMITEFGTEQLKELPSQLNSLGPWLRVKVCAESDDNFHCVNISSCLIKSCPLGQDCMQNHMSSQEHVLRCHTHETVPQLKRGGAPG